MLPLVVRSARVALPGGVRPAAVHILDGRIRHVTAHGDVPAGTPIRDAGDRVVLPGLVDTHVHVNDPGRAHWEGFEHATRAAAAGGVTTIIDMPLNSIPPTTAVDGLETKRRAATGRCHVDVGFWGGVVPGNTPDLEPLAGAGAMGFKCFLSPSGVEEFSHVSERDLREAMPVIARLGLPLLAHAEWPALLTDPHEPRAGATSPRRYQRWLDSRPTASEHTAIQALIALARETGCRLHIVHLASSDALPLLDEARRQGVALSVETCPHYLTFAAEDIADGATALKCAPPIRERAHREGLWAGLVSGRIDFIATDHSPAPPALKHLADGDFINAWGGIASLQLGLSVTWTGMRDRNVPLDRLGAWLATAPAALAGLTGLKGAIVPGADADLVVWDPDASAVVDAATLFHRHPVTPYDRARLWGRVDATLLRGEVIFERGECIGPARGRLLRRAEQGPTRQ